MTLFSDGLIKEANDKKRLWLIVFAVATVVFAAVTLTLLFASYKKEYTPYLLANVLVTTAYGWLSVWLFLNPVSDAAAKIRLYAGMRASETFVEEGTFVDYSEITKEKLNLYSASFTVGGYERCVCFLSEPTFLTAGSAYRIEIKAGVAVAVEKIRGGCE